VVGWKEAREALAAESDRSIASCKLISTAETNKQKDQWQSVVLAGTTV